VSDPFAVTPVDPGVYAVLADAGLSADFFNPRQHRSCELVDRYVLALVVGLVERLGLAPASDGAKTADELVAAAGLVAGFVPRARWLLDLLVAAGLVARDGAGYRAAGLLVAPPPATLRAETLASDPSYAATLELVDEAALAYPRVARGETTGEMALFRRIALWCRYFSNANGYYALGNHVAAVAAARVLPVTGATVVEVGGGLGSAAEALLARAGAHRIRQYRFTEPVEFFRRRAERTIAAAAPDLALVAGALDVNASWEEQGIASGGADLAWGVNVFHLARDLDATLACARAALAPGGWLVVGEGLRPDAGTPVTAEFPFQLLDSFLDVRLDATRRPTAGFLAADSWVGALERAGFADVAVLPDPVRLRARYPGFLAGAVSGRAPDGRKSQAKPPTAK
jgi:SAM-dependent methyltransferase